MGLIKCLDCSKEFSDRINACPNCGCPIEEAKKELNNNKKENKSSETNNVKDEIVQNNIKLISTFNINIEKKNLKLLNIKYLKYKFKIQSYQ